MKITYVTDHNGNIVTVQIPIEEWVALVDRCPDIEGDLFDIPQWQKKEVLRRKTYYEENPNELLSWEEAKMQLMLK